jgi:arylsulfatase A-like enzyme
MKKWHSPELCSVLVVDGSLQQGQGSHGALTRANTRNFMAAIGPDFKSGFRDPSPVSNADIAPTLIHAIGLTPPEAIGKLKGRIIDEALQGGPAEVPSQAQVTRSAPAANGFVTVLEGQAAGDETYFDAAGMPGRVVGLKSK